MGTREYLLDKAEQRGIQKERAKAAAEKSTIVRNLIEELHLENDAIARIAEVSLDFVQKVRAGIKMRG